jgi:nitrous oxidase accessory protein
MYSKSVVFDRNIVRDNLLGMALMYSKTLVARENSLIEHRRGSSPYGLLLKDVDNIELTANRIQANQVGIYAEGVSMAFESNSTFKNNYIVGNLCGISVQSNAKFVFTGNSVIDNLADVRTQSERINADVKWESNGVGNFWSNYRGYDKARDGIGDIPYRVEEIAELAINADDPMQALLYTPGYLVIESATRLFPIFKSTPIVEDTKPMLTMNNTGMTVGYISDHAYLFSSISALILISGVAGVVFFKPFDRRTA